MEIEPEMTIYHCNDPKDNPMPEWLTRKEKRENAEAAAPVAPNTAFFPAFVRPVNKDRFDA